ncbi:MAG: polysulfide reductase NrfD [Chloroflexia bacterium]|nr:polysulfide reductase NrfD [Chloroflexia bacterium]
MSGAAAVIGDFARFFAGPSGLRLARTSTYVSFATLIPCPPLLIMDLGRPRRFFNMLRAFRPSSPMSVGFSGLTAFGVVSTATTVQQVMVDRSFARGRILHWGSVVALRVFSFLGAVAGFLLAGYTGVLLAATAVSLWGK